MKNEIAEFAKLSSEERLKEVMIKGDSKEMESFELLEYAIIQDPDISVRFAALKRIHNFLGHERLIPVLKELQLSEWSKQLEPYLSMALSRVGLITMDEFNQRIS